MQSTAEFEEVLFLNNGYDTLGYGKLVSHTSLRENQSRKRFIHMRVSQSAVLAILETIISVVVVLLDTPLICLNVD